MDAPQRLVARHPIERFRGETPLAEVIAATEDAEAQLVRLRDSQSVPSHPDSDWVDEWLHRSYLTYWATTTEDH